MQSLHGTGSSGTYSRRDPTGEIVEEQDVPTRRGQLELPAVELTPLRADEGEQTGMFPRERVTVQTTNPDRSMVWETQIDELGLGRFEIDAENRRVDATPLLGNSVDRDADGQLASDNCDRVWNPLQIDANGNGEGEGDLCELCAVIPRDLSTRPGGPPSDDACDWVSDAKDAAQTYEDRRVVIPGWTMPGRGEFHPSCVSPRTATSGDVAVAFNPPISGLWEISTVGSRFDTVLMVLDDCRNDEARELRCNNDVGRGLNWSSITYEMHRGETYYVVVDGYNGSAGEFALTLTLTP